MKHILGLPDYLYKKIKNMGISSKIAFIYLVLFVPLFLIVAFITYYLGVTNLLDKTVENNMLVLKNTIDQIDNVIKDMERISRITISDRTLQSILEKGKTKDDYEYLQDQKWFEQFFINLSTIRNDISSIVILTPEQIKYKYNKNGNYLAPNYDYTNEPWFNIARENKGGLIILGTHYIKDFHTSDYLSETYKMAFSVVRQINSIMLSNKPLGYVKVDSDLETMERIINKFKGKDSDIIICDKDWNIIYEKDYSQIAKKLELPDSKRLLSAKSGNYIMKSKSGNMLLTYSTSDYTKWKIISLTPENKFKSGAVFLRNLDYLIIFIGVLMSIAISILLSKAITKNLIRLSKSMKKVEEGNLEVKLEIHSGDEIGELTKTFNSMVKRLRELISREYLERIRRQEVEIEKKNAELCVLQNQINPHFLYNTLDTIRITAALNNDKAVEEMLFTLSSFFMLSIYKGDEITTMEKEVELIKCYMQIHKYRYGDKIQCNYNVPDDILDYKIPRFILQPIVENSIHHGLEPKKGKVLLTVDVSMGDTLEITISDNGKGMAQEEMEKYNSMLKYNTDIMKPIDSKTSGIGLLNVHQRIVLRYGKDYGLELMMSTMGGLTVKMRLPGV